MKLSVVIVNYNVKYYVEQCIRSVYRSAGNMPIEIWVVDNASTDESMNYLKPRFPQVNFIENTENVGFSRANNQAIIRSSGEYMIRRMFLSYRRLFPSGDNDRTDILPDG